METIKRKETEYLFQNLLGNNPTDLNPKGCALRVSVLNSTLGHNLDNEIKDSLVQN